MYIPRKLDRVLREWHESPVRKPLVLQGARQTGKSTSVRQLGKQMKLFIELNLERFEDLRLVRSCKSARELLQGLAARRGVGELPAGTLLFIDEIQHSAQAVQWLRFLYEDDPHIAVIAAGSLLDVRMKGEGFSFPVGRVTFRTIGPLSFFEFLVAANAEALSHALEERVLNLEPVPGPLHLQASDTLRSYLLVGGMPEAVARWAKTGELAHAREVHLDLRQAIAEDVQKYPGRSEPVEAALGNLRHHYGLRFKYENFVFGRRSSEMRTALDKLEGAGWIHRAAPTSSVDMPFRVKAKAAPKLIPLDVGVALTDFGLAPDTLNQFGIDRLVDGRFAECLVGQALLSTADCLAQDLFFWVRESSRAASELDFLVSTKKGGIVPVEVKSGKAGSLKSLHQFLWRAKRSVGIRVHAGPMRDETLSVQMPDGPLNYRLVSLPLYLAEHVPKLPLT